MTHRYTVIGNPIEHSRSPEIHALFAEQTHRQIQYSKTLATVDTFASVVKTFFNEGGRGCNVTVPFKELAASVCDSVSDDARNAGAVNTIRIDSQGRLCGYNTDGTGLVADLCHNLGIELANKSVLIAGAGGSARGIIEPLLRTDVSSIAIVNRSIDKAEGLAAIFAGKGKLLAHGYDYCPPAPFDLLINATSLSLENQRPPLARECIDRQSIAYDLMYGRTTPFMQWATDVGASAHDGFGMLLEQAADAFEIWEGVRPKSRLMRSRL